MSNVRKHGVDRALLAQWFVIVAVFAIGAVALVAWSPAGYERPLVTVFTNSDSDSCRRWMRHLDDRGFRTQVGPEDEWPEVRESVKLPVGFDAPHHAVVQGLFIGGYVPAREIHRALNSPKRASIRGLIVPGAPRGAPGIEAALRESYVVFAMDANGLLRPWATYNHLTH